MNPYQCGDRVLWVGPAWGVVTPEDVGTVTEVTPHGVTVDWGGGAWGVHPPASPDLRLIPTCQIQWVAPGSPDPTPDTNLAVGLAVSHLRPYPNGDTPDPRPFRICAAHALRLPMPGWALLPLGADAATIAASRPGPCAACGGSGAGTGGSYCCAVCHGAGLRAGGAS